MYNFFDLYNKKMISCRNNHEDVEECLNDTWLAAWEYIPSRRLSVLSAYVGRIARGFAIDCFRKKQAAKRMDGHVADVCGEMDELSFSYVVDEKIAEKELIKIIENFLRKLSDSDREIYSKENNYGWEPVGEKFRIQIDEDLEMHPEKRRYPALIQILR